MAKLSQGPFGQIVGKAAGLVGQVYLGKNVIKAYQPKVYNPRTAKQIEARNRFEYLTGLWKLFRIPATYGLRHLRSAVGLNPFNYFTKLNSDAISKVSDDWVADYGMLKLSDGDLPSITSAHSPSSDDPNTIHVTWTNPDPASLPDRAVLKLFAIDPEAEELIPGTGCEEFSSNVSANSYDIDFAYNHSGHSVHVYGICSIDMNANDGNEWPIGSSYIRRSPSFYFGKVTVA